MMCQAILHERLHAEAANHRAFTLIELVVVIAIVGLIVSLTLPAVNSARESSRRLNCECNIRQLGVGMLASEQSTKIVPHNGGLTCDRDEDNKISGSKITAKDGSTISVSVTYLDDANITHVSGSWAWTKTDYAASQVIRWRMDPQPLSKYMSYGLENVAMLGEKARQPIQQSESNWYLDEPLFTGGSRAGTARMGRLYRDRDVSYESPGFGSGHPGGINFVYFSGRTSFVSFDIDSEVLSSMFPDIPFTDVSCSDPRPMPADGS